MDDANLLNLGKTRNGTSIEVNKLVKWADFMVGIGATILHHICRSSGGAKIIQPRICGVETTA